MSDWYERAYKEIEGDYAEGLIDDKEYQQQMRALHEEQRATAEEAAEEAYRDTIGY